MEWQTQVVANLFEIKCFKEFISFLASGILGFVSVSYLMCTFYFVGVNVSKIILTLHIFLNIAVFY